MPRSRLRWSRVRVTSPAQHVPAARRVCRLRAASRAAIIPVIVILRQEVRPMYAVSRNGCSPAGQDRATEVVAMGSAARQPAKGDSHGRNTFRGSSRVGSVTAPGRNWPMPGQQADVSRQAVNSHRRALVLAGGGAAGNAWELGLIAGLSDAGVDLTAGRSHHRDVGRIDGSCPDHQRDTARRAVCRHPRRGT